jgi:hypothetical protein
MARSVRVEFSGAYYHVMARGNRRAAIFLDDDDRRFFVQCLAEACEKTGWRVHAWVFDGKPLPFVHGESRSQPGGADEIAAKHGDPQIQRASSQMGATFRRPLQVGVSRGH